MDMKNLLIIVIALISTIPAVNTSFPEPSLVNHTVDLAPSEVYPGDVFIITVHTNSTPMLRFQGRELPVFSRDKYYQAIAFVNIDTKQGILGIIIKSGEQTTIEYTKVLDKEFPVKHITLKSEQVFLSPDDEKRADREQHILESFWNNITPYPLWSGNFLRPLDSSITSPFGTKRIINGKKESRHHGTDYKGSEGSPVKSINSGEVVLSDNQFYGGNTILINHGLGIYSVYLHLSKSMVSVGDRVSKGQVIGLVGSTGRANGPHLHLSVKLYGESINPESLYKINFSR